MRQAEVVPITAAALVLRWVALAYLELCEYRIDLWQHLRLDDLARGMRDAKENVSELETSERQSIALLLELARLARHEFLQDELAHHLESVKRTKLTTDLQRY